MDKSTHTTLHPTELSRDPNTATYQFTAYTPGCATVNREAVTSSFIIAAEAGVTLWEPGDLEELDATHWQPVLALTPKIVLLGVGDTLIFPGGELTAPLLEQGIGLETMTNDAVCRTYNVLVSEGRSVVAALLLGPRKDWDEPFINTIQLKIGVLCPPYLALICGRPLLPDPCW